MRIRATPSRARSSASTAAGGADQALTDANGEYRLEGLGGDVVVSASARGYVQTEGVRVRMDGDVRLDIDLAAQTDESNNRIPLQQQ